MYHLVENSLRRMPSTRILMYRLSLFFIFISSTVFAQIEDLVGVTQDLVFLSEQYVTPAAEAAVYQSSGGWYTSAKAKDLWDFEFSLQGNMLFVNSKYDSFLIDESQLYNLTIQGDETTAYSPTALGGDDFVPLEGHIGDYTFEFDSPEGLNESNVKHAQLQVAMGLWKGTTVIVRYSPEIKIKKTDYQILGFGLQHNLNQWFQKSNAEPTFNLAALVSYSNYSVSNTFSAVSTPLGSLNTISVDGKSWAFNLLASKEFSNWTISSALGLTSSSFEYTMGGEGEGLLETLNSALENLADSKSMFKADLGVDYRFHDFSFNSMITFGKFNNLIVGINYNI